MYKKIFLLLILLINLITLISCFNNIIVKTYDGAVKGVREITLYREEKYYAFRGIPYAKPPVGPLRFMAPKPIQPWNDILDATKYKSKCVQFDVGNEDCLHLNVYTPKVNPKKLYSVMVFIYGGGYYGNAADDDLFGPDFFINDKVILVTMNYRLGIFGFMKINGSPVYTGNMGLKDQCLAIKWIYKNIERFGGDKKRITLFGFSAGASSTHLQVLSNCCRHLVQRIILQGGSGINNWAYQLNPNHAVGLTQQINELGYPVEDIKGLINVLKTIDAHVLSKKTNPVIPFTEDDRRILNLDYLPVVEDRDARDAFLTERPELLFYKLKDSKIDLLIGHASHEFMYFMANEIHNPNAFDDFNDGFKIQLPFPGNLVYDYDDPNYMNLTSYIRQYYFDDKPINEETILNYIALMSDMFFVYNIQKTVQKYSSFPSAKTFYYKLTFNGELDYYKNLLNTTIGKTIHADEICYLFRCHVINEKYNDVAKYSLEYYIMKYLVRFWTNFAKYGNPTPSEEPVNWKPAVDTHMRYLDIGNERFSMKTTNFNMMRLWDYVLRHF